MNALAAVAATTGAMAQSVTISGRVDLGHANIKSSSTIDGDSSTSKSSQLAGEQHGRTTSRLTFAGSEDLGGGLKASFNYETRLSPDNTTTPGFDRTRNMFLNLTGGFGSVTVGTFLNAFDTVRGYSAATYSAPGGDFLANHIGFLADGGAGSSLRAALIADLVAGGVTVPDATALVNATGNNGIGPRSTNAIAYGTKIGDITLGVGLTNQKSSTDATALNHTRGHILSAGYASGPIKANLAIGQAKSDAKTTLTNLTAGKTTDTAFAISYDFGVAVPYIQHERTKVSYTSLLGSTTGLDDVTLKTKATEIGSRFPMGAFTPFVTLSRGEVADGLKTSAYQLGTTYDLSKRTYLYVAAGQIKAKTNDVNLNSRGYKAGLVHSF